MKPDHYYQATMSDIATPPDLESPWRAYEGPHVPGCRGFEVVAVLIHDEVFHHPCSCRPLVAIFRAFRDSPPPTLSVCESIARAWSES